MTDQRYFHDILEEAVEKDPTMVTVEFKKAWPKGSLQMAANIFKGPGVKLKTMTGRACTFIFSSGVNQKDRRKFEKHLDKVFENVTKKVWY